MKGKHETESLSSSEFNGHKLSAGHHYDFSQFRSAEHFAKTATPIQPMVDKLKDIHSKTHNKVIMNTARANMDDRDKFLNKFRSHDIDIDHIHIHRAGNLGVPVAQAKADIVSNHINTGKYKNVHMYDDNEENLHTFKGLKEKHPNVNFVAHHVQPSGKTKKL